MKILLLAINSKYIHSNLAVYSLHAFAKKLGMETEILEGTINRQPEELLQAVYTAKPDVLAVSVYIWNAVYAESLLEDIRSVLPETRIWLGGPEATYRAEELLHRHPGIAGIITGEGEETFGELCRYWTGQSRKDLKEITGIVFRDGDVIRRNRARLPVSLDNLPFPYDAVCLPAHKIFYYESSRGCPFGCSYCLSSVEKGVRFRDLRLVKRELQFFLDRNAAQVKFVDRTFNCDRRRTLAIWQYLKEHDNGITNFHFETGAELLSNEEIALLGSLRPGQVQLECGVQSLNPDTLKAIHRKMDFEKLAKNVRALQKNRNIHLHLDLIAGLPFEDLESFRRSFNGVYALRPDALQLGFLKVLSGSPMAQDADEYGCVYRKTPPYEVLFTRWLSYDDLVRLKKIEAVFEIYYNSGQFHHTMEQLQQRYEDGFSMYDALAAFYEKNGYDVLSHSRLKRYVILREWIRQNADSPEAYNDSMLLDLYSRENLKSRPDWAPSSEPYRDRIRAFYRKEAEQPEYLTGYDGYDAKQLRSMTHLEILDSGAVLFDYRVRNPVDYSARMIRIPDF